ncbi:hypothetical protein [Streptomyces sp. NPDC089919]|uniref:hypothetical protein n=1 Tax=Streptomyces sp. NPDC089919 TaxID=3155188 RepID=UPI0034239236
MSTSSWIEHLAAAASAGCPPRRAFDVGAGLRRLAQDAGYVRPAAGEPQVAVARHRLYEIARWALTQTGAATHVADLAGLIGDDGPDAPPRHFEGWLDVDIDGVNVFACALYLANHPESARFWWQLAAGAGHSGAAYCLHLHHVSTGESRDADFWRREAAGLLDRSPSPDAFFQGLETFARYTARAGQPEVPTGVLEAEFGRQADRHDDGGLVCRPDAGLADRILELALHR